MKRVDGGAGQKDDGVAVGGLHGGGSGLGVVEALGAALQEGHWPNSRRRKRKIQRTPMTCQYQTVESTKTWRVESGAGALQDHERGDEGGDAEEEMDGVGDGDEVEEVAAGVGAEVDVLGGELVPGGPLAGEEEQAEGEGGGEPDGGAAGDGSAEAEPLVHGVDVRGTWCGGRFQR